MSRNESRNFWMMQRGRRNVLPNSRADLLTCGTVTTISCCAQIRHDKVVIKQNAFYSISPIAQLLIPHFLTVVTLTELYPSSELSLLPFRHIALGFMQQIDTIETCHPAQLPIPHNDLFFKVTIID